jgi:putative DNA methylase
VRLLRRDELDPDWDPTTGRRPTVWEVAHHLVHRIHEEGEQAAAALLAAVGGHGDSAKELAYRLYLICERKGWATEALDYNSLVTSWPELTKLAATTIPTAPTLL